LNVLIFDTVLNAYAINLMLSRWTADVFVAPLVAFTYLLTVIMENKLMLLHILEL